MLNSESNTSPQDAALKSFEPIIAATVELAHARGLNLDAAVALAAAVLRAVAKGAQ